MTKLTKEEQEMKDSIDAEKGKNIGDHALSTIPKDQSLVTPIPGVNIEGMEQVPASMIALPYVRIVQPTSKNTETDKGKDAPLGTFLFNDTQETFELLTFVLLRAKHELKLVDTNGNFVAPDFEGDTELKPRLSILGITTDSDRLFILSLSATSFTSFGKLIAKFKNLHVPKTWLFELTITTEKTENKKGKFYIANFQLGKELSDENKAHMGEVAREYGLVLDRKEVVPEE